MTSKLSEAIERMQSAWSEVPSIMAAEGIGFDYEKVKAVNDAAAREAVLAAESSDEGKPGSPEDRARLYFAYVNIAGQLSVMKGIVNQMRRAKSPP